MNTPNHPVRRICVALSCAAALALIALPAVSAADLTVQPRIDEAKTLPVATSFKKGTPGEHGGPFVLVVKNTGAAALKIKATIIQSVASHNRPRTIELPEQEIAAGGSHDISDLAVEDQVTLEAHGYAKLSVKVPAAK